MNCPRCGNFVKEGQNTCTNCGLIFISSSNNKGEKELDNSVNNQEIPQSTYEEVTPKEEIQSSQIITSEGNINNSDNNMSGAPMDLLGYYVGKNYNKIKKRKWSWNTLVFGFVYTLYRRMFLISLLWLGIDIASVIIMKEYSVVVIVLLNIIMSFLINYIYLAMGNNKVDNIKRKYWGHSIDELIYRVSKIGGTSGLPVFFFGLGIVASFIIAVFLYAAYYPQYYVDKLYFRSPSDFKDFHTAENKTTAQYVDNVNYCGIVASKEEGYSSIDDYIDKKVGAYKDNDNLTISKVKRSGKEWTLVDLKYTDTSRSYYYIIQDSDSIYSYEFNIYNGFGKKCENYYKFFKYSMKIR